MLITESGHFLLILALLFSGYQVLSARRVEGLIFFCVLGSFLGLVKAFVVSDFSVWLVVLHSHTLKPLLYKIAGTWGNHEGSMLLWLLVLSLFHFGMGMMGKTPLVNKALRVQAGLVFLFALFILLTSNPFLRIDPAPAQGEGLNPLLQNLFLALHPPVLYLGYVGFSAAFSLAAAGLWLGKIDKAWAQVLRPVALLAWGILTIGILLGAYWAYTELGWGGWWFWDPVENASLLPWMAGAALTHSLLVLERRGLFARWVVLLAILTFSLSLLGTFLVRSGVMISVHTFAADASRGLYILLILVISAGAALFLYAQRIRSLPVPRARYGTVSRESLILLNNVFWVAALAVVMLGTLYPLLTEDLLSIGPSFFEWTVLPILFPAFAGCALVRSVSWGQGGKTGFDRIFPAVVCVCIFVVLSVIVKGHNMLGVLGISLALWILTATALKKPAGAEWAYVISHLGLAILMIGAVASSLGSREKIQYMDISSSARLGDHTYTLVAGGFEKGVTHNTLYAVFDVDSRSQIRAEKRFYHAPVMETTEAGILHTWLQDHYITINQPSGDESPRKLVVHLRQNPLMSWIWIGGGLMALGALFQGIRLYPRIQRGFGGFPSLLALLVIVGGAGIIYSWIGGEMLMDQPFATRASAARDMIDFLQSYPIK